MKRWHENEWLEDDCRTGWPGLPRLDHHRHSPYASLPQWPGSTWFNGNFSLGSSLSKTVIFRAIFFSFLYYLVPMAWVDSTAHFYGLLPLFLHIRKEQLKLGHCGYHLWPLKSFYHSFQLMGIAHSYWATSAVNVAKFLGLCIVGFKKQPFVWKRNNHIFLCESEVEIKNLYMQFFFWILRPTHFFLF